jgi:hypothetical protein
MTINENPITYAEGVKKVGRGCRAIQVPMWRCCQCQVLFDEDHMESNGKCWLCNMTLKEKVEYYRSIRPDLPKREGEQE